MEGRVDAWTDGWTDGRPDRGTEGRTDRRTEWRNGTDERRNKRTDASMRPTTHGTPSAYVHHAFTFVPPIFSYCACTGPSARLLYKQWRQQRRSKCVGKGIHKAVWSIGQPGTTCGETLFNSIGEVHAQGLDIMLVRFVHGVHHSPGPLRWRLLPWKDLWLQLA